MSENPTTPPPLSRHAQELGRILRMFGAKPGQQVRTQLLEALWVKHVNRPMLTDLEKAVNELVAAKLLVRGSPDGVVLAQGTSGLR